MSLRLRHELQCEDQLHEHHEREESKGSQPARSATIGNVQLMAAAIVQWVKLPKAWPFARTALGKISR